ncbi:acyl-CoA dehydrogenase family protein [Streptomyces sp. B3I8]|uniref:acyl-CoA dehydrogenase family protein n=1 Tax=Streptomyces sp. B3I8 TaxID=3042303 RepID=UPI00277E651F|nr:acyl-CoA dehydrogenase family protein [Streptomyces sp. B3I8]MDQ0785511.1 alkylation response protein AidB-like acyl-CoA dehydrogenase [Streptomyces sp. B3I8]
MTQLESESPTVTPIALAESLEKWFGDPGTESNSLNFSSALELDERNELPAAGIERLRGFGFNRFFVPEQLGGNLRAAEDILMLTRVIARRDMNVAVSESTQVWMMLAWIGGTPEQQAKHAASVLQGGVVPCLAYSEPEHGADLAANTFRATPDGGQYVLSGEKWPINRGRTSTHVVLLGTTGDGTTPAKRRQSMFLVDRSTVLSGEVTGVPRVPTYGLRGCDISGVAFDETRVDGFARLGAEGEGLELALRGLLVTRTFCTGLSLGTGDTMLRTVGDFLSDRVLYDGPAAEIPYVNESLANAYLSLLVAECESLVAMRGLHLYTEQFSIWGNLAKVQVARLVDFSAKALARTLGARYFMRAHEHVGTFQKMYRDSAVVSVFDGSEPVCMDSIALQLPALAKAYGKDRDEDWRPLYDLRAELPVFEPHRVSVFGRGRDATFASLPHLLDRLAALEPSGGLDAGRLAALRTRGEGLREELEALLARVQDARRTPAGQDPADTATTSTKTTAPALIRIAEELSALHAKVAALGIWLFNRDHLGEFFADGAWLEAALNRGKVHQYETGDLDPAAARTLAAEMHRQRTEGEYFSLLTVRMAEPGAPEEDGTDRPSASPTAA